MQYLFLASVLHWNEDWQFLSGLAIIQKTNPCSFIDSNITDFSQQTKQLKYITEVLLQQLTLLLLYFFPEKKQSSCSSEGKKNKTRTK